MRDALVQNLVDFSGRNPMEMLRYNDSALMALQYFHHPSHQRWKKECSSKFAIHVLIGFRVLGGGLHRVILLDEEKRVKAMITQV